MGAFHVIGIDFQLGRRVHMGLLRQEDVVVFLVRLRLLGVRRHDDPAVEGHFRMTAGNAVDELVGNTARSPVMHQDPEVHPFVGMAQVQALDVDLRPFPHEVDGDVDIPGLTRQDDEGQRELFPRADRVLRAQPDERISVVTVPHC